MKNISTAPKDGTLVWLFIDYEGADQFTALQDNLQAWTIGFNQLADTEIDEWEIVGWDWEQDHFRNGEGKILGWEHLNAPPLRPTGDNEHLAAMVTALQKHSHGFQHYTPDMKTSTARAVLEEYRRFGHEFDPHDPAANAHWNQGVDFAMTQLCKALGVDPNDVMWDAATETLEGDIRAVMLSIVRKAIGDQDQAVGVTPGPWIVVNSPERESDMKAILGPQRQPGVDSYVAQCITPQDAEFIVSRCGGDII
jgi:hypothetical protein